MKKILKYGAVSIITLIAKCALFIHRPFVIAVVGSVGKTTTKEAIYAMVKKSHRARTGKKSYNSEIGVPLAILGLENPWSSLFGWIGAIFKGVWNATSVNFPRYLVLEIGADQPGDVSRIANWLKVDMVVLTRWGETPVHVEFFESPKALKDEDVKILGSLKSAGVVVYNNDDPDAVEYAKRWGGLTFSYGKGAGGAVKDESSNRAMVRFQSHITATEKLPQTAINISDNVGSVMFGVKALGEHFGYPFASAWAVGLALGFDFGGGEKGGRENKSGREKMSEALQEFEPPAGRMNVLAGINDSLLIDDTYNSSPIALEASISAVSELQQKRQNDEIRNSGRLIAVLGEMLELGQYAQAEHQRLGTVLFDRNFSLIFCIGELAKEFGRSAINAGLKEDCVFYFANATDASQEVHKYIAKDDIVLLKGSQASRVEKVTKILLEDQAVAGEVLVRQESFWQGR